MHGAEVPGKNAVAGCATSGRERNACTLDKLSEESPKESKAKKNKHTIGRVERAERRASPQTSRSGLTRKTLEMRPKKVVTQR